MSSGLTTAYARLEELAGRDLGHSDWVTITQPDVDAFADLTNDHQWIHVDPERARCGPFGGPIAHGYLTLSMVSPLYAQLLEVEGAALIVNYGLDKVRFPAPVPVGHRIRLGAVIVEVTEIGGGRQTRTKATIEIENCDKPACVGELLVRYYAP